LNRFGYFGILKIVNVEKAFQNWITGGIEKKYFWLKILSRNLNIFVLRHLPREF
jgi:hypothetical protein